MGRGIGYKSMLFLTIIISMENKKLRHIIMTS